MIRDLSYGIRTLCRTPAFTLLAVLAIALGIAGNTAIFSAIDEQVLRSLPVPHPEQLVELQARGVHDRFTIPIFEYLRDSSSSFNGTFAEDSGRISIQADGQSDFVRNRFVSGNFDAVMGLRPVLGRGFTPADDTPGSSPVALLGYGYWTRKFGGSATVLGKTIFVKGMPLKIVGVCPDVTARWTADVWVPMALHPALSLNDNTTVGIFARLKPGIDPGATSAELSGAYQQALTDAEGRMLTPAEQREIAEGTIQLVPIGRGGSKSFSTELQILATAVAFVLLIACANVASLLLARATARRREIAVRLALGASRARLVRQLLAEGLLLSVCGGGIGFLLAWWASSASGIVIAHRALAITPDPRMLAFTICLSIFVTILFALVPALQATAFGKKDQPNLSTSTSASDLQSRARIRNSLLVVQVALSVVSLVGAGLLLRTLTKLQGEELGFQRNHLLVTWVFPTLAGYEGDKETALYWRLLDTLNSTAGISSASMSRMQLLSGGYWGCSLAGQSSSRAAKLNAACNSIAPRFFETLGIPFVAGRDFSYSDKRGGQKVAIISESTARDYFPGENPVGKELRFHAQDEGFKDPLLVVGVVKDIHTELRDEQRHRSLRGVYIPFAQAPEEMRGQAVLEVRTPGNPNGAVAAVRQQVKQVDAGLPLVDMQTQSEVMEEALENDRSLAVLTSTFGALALTLTCIGLYGSVAYSVARRTREIGIRMALGSSREGVLAKLMREAGTLIAQGLFLGAIISVALTRAISSQLYGVSSYDPKTFGTALALMVGVALAAAYVPARRAMAVDPIVALRYE